MVRYSTVCYFTFILLEIGGYLFTRNSVSSTLSHVPLAVFMVVSLFFLLQNKKKRLYSDFKPLQMLFAVYLTVTFVIHVLIHKDAGAFLSVSAGWGVAWVMARRIELPNVYRFVIGYFLVMAVISIAVQMMGITSSSIIPGSGFKINLSYVEQKHFTGAIGFLLFALSLDKRLRVGDLSKKIFILMMLISSAIVVFSYSRGYILATTFFALTYLVTYKFKGKFLSITLPLILIVGSVAFPLMQYRYINGLDIGIFDNILGINRGVGIYEYADMTAGRMWLWNKHIEIFQLHKWIGVGNFSIIDYVNTDYDMKRAESESFFTFTLARDGIIAFLNPIIFFVMIGIAKARNNRFGYALGFMMLVSAAVLGSSTNFYDTKTLIVYLLYFSSFYEGFNVTSRGLEKQTNYQFEAAHA